VYNSIVRPYFTYCCEVWDVFGETQSKRLQKLQNRAARIIMNMSNDVDHPAALDALDWKPLKTERIKAKSKLMFNLLNKMCPKALNNVFTFKSEMKNYKLGDVESTLCLPQPDSPPVAFKYKYL
jgi:hypothetical protein